MSTATPQGLLVLDKPRGISSHTAVQKVRGLFQTRKVGHAGTLDPEATGVMVLALGKATRLLEYYSSQEKSYVADLELGKVSSTGDVEGELTASFSGEWPHPDTIELTFDQFRGMITQIPPIYSAVKVDGERLYKKARRGETVDIPSRQVTISRLEIEEYAPPALRISVTCSKGTYIRTLAEDIGLALNTGAYLTGLRRTASGQFTLQQAQTFEALEAMSMTERLATLLPLGHGLPADQAVELSDHQLEEVLHGRDVALTGFFDAAATKDPQELEVFAWYKDELVAILERRVVHTPSELEEATAIWKPRKVFLQKS